MSPFQSAQQSFTYPEFYTLTESLVALQRTTGPDQSEAMVHYTKLNLHRMKRWNKTFQPNADLVNVLKGKDQNWWVITEPWCGDSSQSLPILAAIANAADIPMRIVLRDDYADIMDEYLTNGSRSIPILVAFDSDGKEIFRWGPRPAEVQKLVTEWKQNPGDKSYDDIREDVHRWYLEDRGEAVQEELARLATK